MAFKVGLSTLSGKILYYEFSCVDIKTQGGSLWIVIEYVTGI
jgi:hypothetical protein